MMEGAKSVVKPSRERGAKCYYFQMDTQGVEKDNISIVLSPPWPHVNEILTEANKLSVKTIKSSSIIYPPVGKKKNVIRK